MAKIPDNVKQYIINNHIGKKTTKYHKNCKNYIILI